MLTTSILSIVLPLILNVDHVVGKTLVPIRPGGSSALSKREQDKCGLDLKSAETFSWGDEDGSQIASLRVDMPGDEENILDMERFDGMVTKVSCNANDISMTFKDDPTFLYAQQTWDWVNGADNHSFVMVAGPGHCGDNVNRIPYIISTMQFDEEANTAVLQARKTEWEAVAHSFDFVVGASDFTGSQNLTTRDITKQMSLNFEHNFPWSTPISPAFPDVKLSCETCGTTGSFGMEFRVSQKWFVPTGASFKLNPKGVSAIAKLKLSGTGADSGITIAHTWPVFSYPISPLNIPGILELGPFLRVSIGASLSSLKMTGAITAGAKAYIDDSSSLAVDLLHLTKPKVSGWKPKVEAIPFAIEGDTLNVTSKVGVFLQPSIDVTAKALGMGFQLGLNLRAPNVNAELTAIASKTGACGATARKTPLGLKVAATVGASLDVQAQLTGKAKPLFALPLADLKIPVADTCWPMGKTIAKRVIRHPHARRGLTVL